MLFPPGSNTLMTLRNNLIASTSRMIEKYSPWVISLDYDDLYTTASGDFAWWEDWSHSYTTFAAFQGALGQEPRGLSAPAQLVNPAAGDFRPLASSPLIDRGVQISGINDVFNGSAPDIGAYEADGATAVTVTVTKAGPEAAPSRRLRRGSGAAGPAAQATLRALPSPSPPPLRPDPPSPAGAEPVPGPAPAWSR